MKPGVAAFVMRIHLAVISATVIAASALAISGAALATVARTVPADRSGLTPLAAGQSRACPVPSQPGEMECTSIYGRRTGPLSGYTPGELRSAYEIQQASDNRGQGATIAVVDAYRNPAAASDLAVYRRHFGLPACTVTSGCLRIVNEHGKRTGLPGTQPGWAMEESTDLDMVSAICPHCRLVLLEARNDFITSMGLAEDTAARLGAVSISDSWSGFEFVGEQAFDHYFNHPGHAVVAASGDYGYGTSYPADIQYVTSVGGTTLSRARNSRGWRETAWDGTGSGCSGLEPKPSWQRSDATAPGGCLNRTQNDAAAVANPSPGVAVYNGGWTTVGGTSVATPIIAAMYALAGPPAPGTYPASYPYLHPASFHHIIGGSNGTCESYRRYLCTAVAG